MNADCSGERSAAVLISAVNRVRPSDVGTAVQDSGHTVDSVEVIDKR
jgi:hypothetical protein